MLFKKGNKHRKGKIPWNKGKTYEETYGKEKAEEMVTKMKERKHSEETKKKIRKFTINRFSSIEERKKISIGLKKYYKEGNKSWQTGLKGEEYLSHLKNGRIWNKGIKMWEHKEHPRGSLGKKSPFKGKKHSKESLRKIKKSRSKQVFPIKDSSIELKIQDFLTFLKIEFVTHKYMNIKHGYQCDIFVPSMNLIIECDGDFFHMNPNKFSPGDKIFGRGMAAKERWELDDSRTKELLEKGYHVIRIWENEIKKMNINDFKNKLKEIQE